MSDLPLRTLKAVADPNRLRILAILSRGPFHVAELTEILGVVQSTVSRHLKILSDVDLVEVRRAGTWAFYSLAATGGFPGRLLELLESTRNGDPDVDAHAIERVLARRRMATSEFFRRTASSWDDVHEGVLGTTAHRDRLLEMVGTCGVVVDLGTGTGALLEALAPNAEHVIGVDASAEMLEVARARAAAGDSEETELRLGMLEHLPLSDGEADTMIANMVLHHVADLPGVLHEVRRGLTAGGRFLIADLEEHDDESFWKTIGARWPGFRFEDIREQLLAGGFEVVRHETLPITEDERPPVFLVEARRLDSLSNRGGQE